MWSEMGNQTVKKTKKEDKEKRKKKKKKDKYIRLHNILLKFIDCYSSRKLSKVYKMENLGETGML